MSKCVLQDWLFELPLQQQSVLILALRGMDGFEKNHGAKPLLRYLRGVVLNAAMYGEPVGPARPGDSFMRGMLEVFDEETPTEQWQRATRAWHRVIDSLPLHGALHFLHAAEIVGYHHPDNYTRVAWHQFYLSAVQALHMNPETAEQMNARLCDWNQAQWYGR